MTKAVIFDPIRQQIADEAGIPFDHVLISASHTHSGPVELVTQKYVKILESMKPED